MIDQYTMQLPPLLPYIQPFNDQRWMIEGLLLRGFDKTKILPTTKEETAIHGVSRLCQ